MTRQKRKIGLAGLAGLLVMVALTISAAPAGATVICQPGKPKTSLYCVNIPPVATTHPATNIKSESATLNGTAGPGVANGDPTTYFFQYGLNTSYGKQTPSGTVGSCPPGKTGVNYCTSPVSQNVSAALAGLTPCTTYHYRTVATNPDLPSGTFGGDQAFRTSFLAPIVSVKFPGRVKRSTPGHKRHFTVTVKLRTKANVTITLQKTFVTRKHHRRRSFTVVYHKYFKRNASGTVKAKFPVPKIAAKYTIKTVAKLGCGSETIKKTLKVHR